MPGNRLRHLRQFLSAHYGNLVRLFKQSAEEWNTDAAQRLGAALAFYTLLSLAPVLVVIVGVAALAYGRQAAAGQLAWEIGHLVGNETATAVQALIQAAYEPRTGVLATTLSILTVMYGASSVMVELRDDLNIIWGSGAAPAGAGIRGVLRLVKDRFYSLVLVVVGGLVLLFLLAASVAVAAVGRFFRSRLPASEPILHVGTFFLSFLIVAFLFAALYRTLPDVRLKWSDVMPGASVASLTFAIGKQLIGLYLGKASFTSTYGAAGSLVVLLVWVYYSAQLFFFGAEFTKVFTRTFGSHRHRMSLPQP
jgi:membrane protein